MTNRLHTQTIASIRIKSSMADNKLRINILGTLTIPCTWFDLERKKARVGTIRGFCSPCMMLWVVLWMMLRMMRTLYPRLGMGYMYHLEVATIIEWTAS